MHGTSYHSAITTTVSSARTSMSLVPWCRQTRILLSYGSDSFALKLGANNTFTGIEPRGRRMSLSPLGLCRGSNNLLVKQR